MVPVMDEVLTSVSAEEASAEGVSADSETCVETVSSAEETRLRRGLGPASGCQNKGNGCCCE